MVVTGWLLDTNILSELRRPKPERKVLAFVAAQPLDLLYVSTATLAEIRFGIERVSGASRRAELNDWLAHKARPMFEEANVGWAKARSAVPTHQRKLQASTWARFALPTLRPKACSPKLIIAATALHHGLTVVSRDVRDYQKARAPVFNPWVDPPPASP